MNNKIGPWITFSILLGFFDAVIAESTFNKYKKFDDSFHNQIDINNDISDKNLEILVKNSKLSSKINEIKDSNIFIITVPTPINDDKTPDLDPLRASSELVGSIINKGSIAINGVSLTINEIKKNRIRIDIIPHTFNKTNFKFLKKNMIVNLEYDLLMKFLKK